MTSVPAREASQLAQTVPTPGLYRHFKGGQYEVLEVARHSETEELLVIYCSLDDPDTTWVRPLEMFTEIVAHAGGEEPRFAYISQRSRTANRLQWLGMPFMAFSRRFASARGYTGTPIGTHTRLN